MKATSHLNLGIAIALTALVAACAAAVAAPAGAMTSVSPALKALTDPPVKPPDAFDDQRIYDSTVAGLCVTWADVYDPSSARASGTTIAMSLSYPGSWRENVMQMASSVIRLNGQHLAIWLYRWNGRTWAYSGQSRVRYPATTFPYWSRPAGDNTFINTPSFNVPSDSGYYTIRVGLVSARGVVVDTAYVKAFGHTNLDGETSSCNA
jgi:hypothetical protein